MFRVTASLFLSLLLLVMSPIAAVHASVVDCDQTEQVTHDDSSSAEHSKTADSHEHQTGHNCCGAGCMSLAEVTTESVLRGFLPETTHPQLIQPSSPTGRLLRPPRT